VTLQIKTITDLYTLLSNTLDIRQKYTNPKIQKQENKCENLMEIFRDATASYLVNEIEILSKDLYPASQDISDISKSQRTTSILMQVILNLNEIISHVQHETTELENYSNYRTTDNTLLAIQNSSCIEKTLMESISVIGFLPTATGLSVSLTINQFESSENTFSIVSTSYFGRELDISNTYLINENLFKCK